ncbi:Maintenance of ploidy protein mob2 [Rhizophlyctis rosea]|uniref:Maintenance of ploidy protein mob2 n=1 Tax=Rhizophlyctis rosea TaxID=64517 RepID=A0AAD5X4Y8_9FUNG|nr:Maintenance of ploidy protein mob2 [Rhizophlyctis rosea]
MNFFNTKFGKGKGKKDGSNKPLFLCQPFVSATLVNGSLRKVVALPRYVDLNEWLAVNTFDFFNYTNLFFGSVAIFCTAESCPVMHGGPGHEYMWTDSQKRSIKVPAPHYVDYAMSALQNHLNDEQIFPTHAGADFPPHFQTVVKHIFKQLFRIFAHIYHGHYDKILHMSAEGHLNTLFAHFICFAREFDLIEKKELAPLAEFISELEATGRI